MKRRALTQSCHGNAPMLKSFLCQLIAPLGLSLSIQGQIFVSPQGDDTAPGTSTAPVKTLSRAVELSRTRASGQPKQIRLKAGAYYDTGVSLTSNDSNLTIESELNSTALLVGGVSLSGWQPDGDRFWSARLTPDRQWDIRMLQVSGRFCPRARFPEQGTLDHESVFNVPWMSTTGGGWKRKPTALELTTLRYKEGDLPADINLRSAEITVFHMWDESVAGIAERDISSRTLKLSPALGHPPGAFGVQKYCLWNLREGMTHPGQWYFDRPRNRIVYWPLPGERTNEVSAVVPTQRVILRIAGATNVTVRNLDLAVTSVPLITGGFAAGAFEGAIQLERASGTTLSGLHIRNVAGHAIRGTKDQHRTIVADCEIAECGAGGVYLSGPFNIISNTLIHTVGVMFPSAMGINGGGENCRLSHNEIFDTTYSAIGFGGRNVVIENNRISDCMKVLHDGAAIYCFGTKHTFLRNNFAHDIVDTGGYGASAYYLDEQCEDSVVESNLCLNVARPSHNHMATNNIIRNNVFISLSEMRLTFPRCTGYQLQGNVLYAGGPLTFEGINNVASWSGNLIYSGTGKIEGTTLKDYSSTGTVPGTCGDTVVGDPQFRDIAKLDLAYGPDSPALKLGIRALDLAATGRVLNSNHR